MSEVNEYYDNLNLKQLRGCARKQIPLVSNGFEKNCPLRDSYLAILYSKNCFHIEKHLLPHKSILDFISRTVLEIILLASFKPHNRLAVFRQFFKTSLRFC